MARQLGRNLYTHLTELRQLRSSSTALPAPITAFPSAGPPRLVKPDGRVIVPVPKTPPAPRQKRPRLVRILHPHVDQIMDAIFGDELTSLVEESQDELTLEEALTLSGMAAGRFPTRRIVLTVRPRT